MQNEPTLTSGAILRRGSLRAAIYDRLTRSLGKEPETATPRDIYDALSLAVREELSARWLATQRRVARARVKRLCYLSVEFLPGRSLVNALSSLDSELIDEARSAVASMGHDFDAVVATPERDQFIAYTAAHIDLRSAIFIRKGAPPPTNFAALKDFTIGTTQLSAGHQYLQRQGFAKLNFYPRLIDALTALDRDSPAPPHREAPPCGTAPDLI